MLNELISKFSFNNNDKIPDPPYSYDLLANLAESEYPKYLKKTFKYLTGKELNLKNPQTFNEKIQWLKLYDATELKTRLTDKILVRDWVKDKIGSEYLKPVLQICSCFDEINFDNLPNSFMVKANNGCKWHYRIKDKEKLLTNDILKSIVKKHFDGWL